MDWLRLLFISIALVLTAESGGGMDPNGGSSRCTAQADDGIGIDPNGTR